MPLNPLWPDMMDIKYLIISNPSQQMPFYHGWEDHRTLKIKKYICETVLYSLYNRKKPFLLAAKVTTIPRWAFGLLKDTMPIQR